MERYTEITTRNPPASLFHYTNNSAALSIITSGEIWATNIHYLNDSSEFKHALMLLKDELTARRSATQIDAEVRAYEQMAEEADLISGINVVTVSFSEKRDDLSQWRGYANGSGVAIGFDAQQLREQATRHGFVLAPCIYGEDDHLGLIDELITDALPKYLASTKRTPHLTPRIIKYAPLIKHGKFSAEEEWRLTSGALSCDVERYGFRANQSTLVPYYAFPIKNGKESLITEVVCGPTPHRELAHSAINSLLLKNDIPAEASLTEIPFRNW